jgi:hypothetical protein
MAGSSPTPTPALILASGLFAAWRGPAGRAAPEVAAS